jgi:hypothetical protein
MTIEKQTQVSTVRSEREFGYHPAFQGWKGVEYTEETVNGKRHYTIDGVAYPSITTVLSYDPEKIRALARWRARVGQDEADKVSRHSTTRGTALHKLCENYLTHNQTDIKNYLEKENFFKVKSLLERGVGPMYCMEKPLYSRELGVAGRCDLITEFKTDLDSRYYPTVIDFKTSGKTKYHKNIHQYFVQGAAYATMFQEMTGVEVPRIVIIIVTEELNEPQVFVEQTKTWIQPLNKAIATYRESIHVKENHR